MCFIILVCIVVPPCAQVVQGDAHRFWNTERVSVVRFTPLDQISQIFYQVIEHRLKCLTKYCDCLILFYIVVKYDEECMYLYFSFVSGYVR